MLASALLHDTVEDTDTTREELTMKFGPEIDGYVAEVTDDNSHDGEERKKLQVLRAPDLSRGARLIRLADKISNVREIGADPPKEWSDERRRKYFDWAKRVVDATGRINPELEKLFADTFEGSLRSL